MNENEKYEIAKSRYYTVVKSNELVQRSRFELSLTEQKTVAYVCSMIKPVTRADKIKGVPYQLEYDFNIRDYCKICGLDYDNGKNYRDIKAILQKLSDRSMWVTFPENPDEEVLCRWLSKVKTNKKSGVVHIKLDEDLAPCLFELGRQFTQYQLCNVLAMKSAFSVRMYELMKSYEYKKSVTFDLEELKKILMVQDIKSYDRFPDFRRKVLEISLKEINELSDIKVVYSTITKGKKVVKITFHIKPKNVIERIDRDVVLDEKLK